MKNQINSLVKIANSEGAKKFKKIIFFVFIALVVLDIVFVSFSQFPTISRVIYNSSPKFIVLIWLFGLFISNVFLQRKVSNNINFVWNLIILVIISVGFIIIGNKIIISDDVKCSNYQTIIKKVEIKYVTRVLCQEFESDSFHYENRDCETLNCNSKVGFKLDLTNEMKLLILVLGVIAGYLFWPKIIET
ncbi:hypothetical protein [Hyunsoonleella pacifica]|uniref:Uncharacterized protein n=1 Tax=Hyunsoonleella pacifica TaxID=1080224 RepID=A0A4V2JB86_9FLAO|nr:hypothetical protein [Hyunsoonleella pacifica]TBN17778.1 hypothetical protein EYD46_05555 [Hyunsoonleella pacifica]GGD09041.1 hypothetical protein GCM10011368_08720 [Hyunsoonleella pacifica]